MSTSVGSSAMKSTEVSGSAAQEELKSKGATAERRSDDEQNGNGETGAHSSRRVEECENEMASTFYSVKWIEFDGTRRPIIMQNANGCCPLLALANVLLLRGRLNLHDGTELVEAAQLLNDLTAYLFESCCYDCNVSETHRLNWQQNAQDVLDCAFPKLQTGLDMNVRFVAPDEFECTSELLVFDMLNVRVYHGWLVDPQDQSTHVAVHGKSYNQLIDFIVTHSHEVALAPARSRPASVLLNSDDRTHSMPSVHASGNLLDFQKTNCDSARSSESDKWMEIDALGNETQRDCALSSKEAVASTSDGPAATVPKFHSDENFIRALAAHEFLNSTATQLTVYGLAQLQEHVKEEELCVFFRNNHFATLTKRSGILYLLVTDAGYLGELSIVWETLDNVEGNSTYVDGAFQPCAAAHAHACPELASDADFQVAVALQREEDALAAAALQQQAAASPPQQPAHAAAAAAAADDRKSKRGGKREADRSSAKAAARSQSAAAGARRSGQSSDGCTLL